MTCDETRELLSALLDEALDAGERAHVEAHLAGCAECRRELDGIRATTGLLARVERARAPAGFVDRVMTQVRPVPWYRRLGRALFFPLSVKLPLEAGAMVMVALLGVYLLQTTPELKDAARHDSPPRVSSPPAVERLEPSAPSPPPPPPARDREAESKRQALVRQGPPAFSGDDARRGARDEAQKNVESPAAPPAQEPPRAEAPTARSHSGDDDRQEPRDEAQKNVGSPAPPPAQEPPKTEAPTARSQTSRSTEARESVPKRTDADKKGAPSATPAAPFFLSGKQQMAAAVVSGALTVTDRQRAEQSLAEVIRKTGARKIARHEERGAVVVEVAVPQSEYAAFTRELATLGSLRLEGQPTEIPPLVRLQVRISE